MIFVSHLHFIRYILKKRNVILLLMFNSTYILNMKAFPFFIPEKKRQIGFQTKISVTHGFSCFTSCQPHPFYSGKILRVQQRQLSQLQFGGFFGGGYGPAAVGDSLARARLSHSKERVWSNCIERFVISCPRNP